MPIKVSLLVAAYNIEPYIEPCLDSLMNQTLQEIEIIVVNDGSTDDTLAKIQDKAKQDQRIKIIDQENHGLSDVRRIGFNAAKGEYIQFVDGDDWLELNACEKLYDKTKVGNTDVVLFHYAEIYEDNREVKMLGYRDKKKYLHPFKEFVANNYFCSICTKLIRRQFLIDCNFEFPKGITHGEDNAFSAVFFMHNPIIVLANNYFYYYRKRSGSAAYNLQGYIDDSEKIFEIISNTAKILSLKDSLNCYVNFYIVTYLSLIYLRLLSNKQKKQEIQIKKNIFIKQLKLTKNNKFDLYKTNFHYLYYQIFNISPSLFLFLCKIKFFIKKCLTLKYLLLPLLITLNNIFSVVLHL